VRSYNHVPAAENANLEKDAQTKQTHQESLALLSSDSYM
jgi:hypothetical protein